MTSELLTRDSPAERRGGVWDYVSPSRLNLWLKCPLAFRLKYIDDVKTPVTSSLFIGRMCHAALECYYRHRQLGITLDPPEIGRRLAESWEQAAVDQEVEFPSVADDTACRRQAGHQLAAYLRQLHADEPKPLAVETAIDAPLVDPTSGEDLGIPLVSVMDLVLPAPPGPIIADFKTTARGGEPLEITHEIQLSSYSYLYRHSSQQAESALEIRNLVTTKTPRVETHRFASRDARHYRRLFAVIRSYLDNLNCGRFVFRPELGCGSCEFLDDHCRAWSG